MHSRNLCLVSVLAHECAVRAILCHTIHYIACQLHWVNKQPHLMHNVSLYLARVIYTANNTFEKKSQKQDLPRGRNINCDRFLSSSHPNALRDAPSSWHSNALPLSTFHGPLFYDSQTVANYVDYSSHCGEGW